MPEITLYGPQATRAMRATWMLRELGIAFDHRTEPPPASVNPNGKVRGNNTCACDLALQFV